MKAVRDRMRKSLSVSTKKDDKRNGAGRNVIRFMTEDEVHRLYKLKGQVMESTNTGMDVLFATRNIDGVDVVIKTREKRKSFKSTTEEREWRYTTEVQINMPKIDTICQYIEVLETRDYYYIVMEKVEGMDLFEHMHRETIPYADAREILRQILEALKVFHANGRIHKDLKLENVMVEISPKKSSKVNQDLNGSPITSKLIDFDTVQDWEPSSPRAKDVLGTDGYIAPEAYAGEYSPASDIYCVGVIMYKLLTRKFPSNAAIFDDLPGENWVGSPAMKRIQERLRQEKIDFKRPPLDSCPTAADLCKQMLSLESQDRPSAEEALRHAWFGADLQERPKQSVRKQMSNSSPKAEVAKLTAQQNRLPGEPGFPGA